MLNKVGYQVQTCHCAIFFKFFYFLVMNAHTLVISKSYSNEKLQGMNKLSQITDEYMKPPSHETTFQAKIFESMSNDGMKGVV